MWSYKRDRDKVLVRVLNESGVTGVHRVKELLEMRVGMTGQKG